MDAVEPAAVPPILDAATDRLGARVQAAAAATAGLRGERRWLGVMAAAMVAEFGWWLVCSIKWQAPLPMLGTYALLAFGALAATLVLRHALAPARPRATTLTLLVASCLIAISASLFLPLKFAIPSQLPFWLDGPLATFERGWFGVDPWIVLDRLFGGLAAAIDRIYGLWLPVQTVVLFALVLEPPSARKSRALIAYSLAWFVLGVGAAVALSSAGPIFYDRLYGGQQFAALRDMLEARGCWMTLGESDAMWAAFAEDKPGLVAGISAAPSLHVAISAWMWLTARSLAPRAAPYALTYIGLIWVGSVQLGWHYVSDGLIGAAGMGLIWLGAGALERGLPSTGRIVRIDSLHPQPSEKP